MGREKDGRGLSQLTLRSLLLFTLLFQIAGAQTPARLAGQIATAHQAGEFDGVVVLSQNGKVVSTSALGFSDRYSQTPLHPETIFRLASLTKQVTALLVMQEVSAGRLTLDRKTGEILTSLPNSAARVTVRQLLQHVSGLPNPSDGPEDKIPPFYTRTQNLDKTSLEFCTGTAKREPGEKFEYNNCDYIILGALLEATARQPFAAILQERVIKPLGLKSWGMFPADPKQAPRVAFAYKKDGTPDDPQNPATYGASGGLYGNALDVANWNDALLTHKLLSPALTEQMFRADPKLYGEALGSWAYDSPCTTPPVHVIERQGEIGSTRLLSLLLPQRDASVVIIANADGLDFFNTHSKQGLAYKILSAWLAGE